jgi:hypothetical protein
MLSWVWDAATPEPVLRESSQIWLNRDPPPGDWILVAWKAHQKVHVVDRGEPIDPILGSRLDLGGGSAAYETGDAYPLAAWHLAAGSSFMFGGSATPVGIAYQGFGPEYAWTDTPRGDLVATLAGNPGCGGCLPVDCGETQTIRWLCRRLSPFVGRISLDVTLWLRLREQDKRTPCES